MVSRVNEYYENDINDQDLAKKFLKNNSSVLSSSGVKENEYFEFKAVFGNERLSEFEPFRYFEFPQELRHQLNKSQSHISMGLFSTIGRAWMSVDGDLFFWKFDTNSDLAYFDSIKDTITHVQLVYPKRQYTDSKIHFIVVVVTSAEILLFGLGFNDHERIPLMREASIEYQNCEMLIFAEPLYRISNDTPVQNVVGTKEGRIFIAGQDSLLELNYQTGSWFRGPKCEKYNHTKHYISTFIPAISFLSAVEEIRSITVDDTRHILYTLGDKSTIQVFDLGEDGLSLSRKKTCSLLDIQKEIRISCGVEDDFLAGIVAIHAIPSTRSQYACLEAVTSKGMRIYFTVYSTPSQTYPMEQHDARPSTLHVIHIRYPPNEIYGLNRGVNIYCAQRESESFILGHMIDENETSMTAFSSSSFQYNPTFAESIAVFPFAGSVWAMSLLPEQPASSSPPHIVPTIETPWIVRQHAELMHKLYILSSEGVYIFQQLSPLEIFRRLLTLYDCDSRQFLTYLKFHEAQEICVMALTILATNLAEDAQVENSAVRVLMEFGGCPTVSISHDVVDRSFYSPGNQSIANLSALQTPLRSSTPQNYQMNNDENAMVPLENIIPSFRHDAFYTYFSRIVANLWNTRICVRQNNLAFNALPMREVENVINYTGSLLAAIRRYNLLTYNAESKIFDQENVRAFDTELRSLQEYERMVTSTHEFLNLWRILDEHQFHVLTQLLPDDIFSGLGNVTLAQAILTCKETSAEFVTALVKHYIGDEATTAVISQRLTEECPSLFTSQDAHILKASEHIAIAKSLPMGLERQRAIQTAVDFLRKCVQRVNMGLICDLLRQINAYDSITDLALQRAFNEDPSKIAVIAYRESISQIDPKVRDAVIKRGECYKHIDNALDYLQQEISKGSGTEISVPLALSQRDAIIQRVLESDDELAHINLFQWMLKNGMEDRLLKKQQRFFEQYLIHEIKEGGGENYLKLLWKYYEKNENYVSAAKLLLDFAGNSPKIDLKGRITYLSHALLCIQSASETRQNQELKQRVQEFLDVTQIQQQTFDEIAKISGIKISENEAKNALEQLNSRLFTLTELFSSFADQFNLPIIKLGIVKCANHYDPETIEDIWKEILKQEYESCSNDLKTLRARLTSTLSKLYRLYGSSKHYVPIEFIIRELLLKGSQMGNNASWLPMICKDSGISLAALLHHVQSEFRQDPFWRHTQQLQYIINMGKFIFEDFMNEQNRMNHTDRSVLKEKCLSFISALQLNVEEIHGMPSPVASLKMYEEELKLI